MAPLLLLLLLLLLISPSSASRSYNVDTTAAPTPHANGPITTKGQTYRTVCNPARFTALGLDMNNFPYCNASLPYPERVKDLIGRMTVGEKVKQISDDSWGVERIGLPPYGWWSEILHGVSTVGQYNNKAATRFGGDVPGATQFPEVILSTASFNESLWRVIAETVSTEARAMYNLGHTYLTFWSPVINIVRDPRWGRVMETPGEDPFVIGRYSVNFVRGLQDVNGTNHDGDPNTRPIKVGSCCKHFTAYDVENWYGYARFSFDARVSEQDMVESVNLPFEMCIKEGDSVSAMCSYNQINGIPACADARLLSQTIRGEWDLHGYIVSDCYIYQYLHDNQHWLQAPKEALVAKVINAGLDLECGFDHQRSAIEAVKQGLLKEKEIDRALTNLYTVLLRLGFFDGHAQYDSLGVKDICSQEHMDLAADAARQGMVLLKNIDNTLPLNKSTHKSLALGGTHVNATGAMLGNYAGIQCRFVTPLGAFQAEAQVNPVLGCDLNCNDTDVKEKMKTASAAADATILFMGINTTVEAENLDRTDLFLRPGQVAFVTEVANASKNPIVLVILSAGGIDISFARDHPKVGAIIWAGYPGQEGGRAIADIVYGRYNPGGRLPITWYPNDYILQIPMTSMPFRPIPEFGYPGRTYKFYNGSTVYPFGHGLSYTTFSYTVKAKPPSVNVTMDKHQKCLPADASADTSSPCLFARTADMSCKESIDFDVEVANSGNVNGTDALIIYAIPPPNTDGAPIKQVVAFQSVFVPAGGSQTLHFSINVCHRMSFVEKTAYRVLPSGKHTIAIGDSNVSFPVEVNLTY